MLLVGLDMITDKVKYSYSLFFPLRLISAHKIVYFVPKRKVTKENFAKFKMALMARINIGS